MIEIVTRFIWKISAVMMAIVFHELAHGYVALYEGDSTAREHGRLTLNPFAHIDPLMSIVLPSLLILSGSGIVFGAAKPIPINPWRFKHRRKGEILVSVAGVSANLLLAVIFGFLTKIDSPYQLYFYEAVVINVVLAVFNMLPVPPLDGSRLVAQFLPSKYQSLWRELERYGIGILLILIFIFGGIFWAVISPVIYFLINVFT